MTTCRGRRKKRKAQLPPLLSSPPLHPLSLHLCGCVCVCCGCACVPLSSCRDIEEHRVCAHTCPLPAASSRSPSQPFWRQPSPLTLFPPLLFRAGQAAHESRHDVSARGESASILLAHCCPSPLQFGFPRCSPFITPPPVVLPFFVFRLFCSCRHAHRRRVSSGELTKSAACAVPARVQRTRTYEHLLLFLYAIYVCVWLDRCNSFSPCI